MNAHTRRITNKMINFLDDYLERKCCLKTLVNSLEGSMDAIEEDIPVTFQEQWFIIWGKLEIILATDNEYQYRKEVLDIIEGLKILITQIADYPTTELADQK